MKIKMKTDITLFGRINWTTYGLTTISVQDAISIIRDGAYYIDDNNRSGTLCDITKWMQSLPESTDLQSLKAQFLPAVSFNGIYENGIKEYSNVTALDFDDIPSPQHCSSLYQHLMSVPFVWYIYRTPSGRGLKAIVLHDNTDSSKHGNMYEQLIRMFQIPFIKTDSKCKDLSRRNYLCYDPDVWINPTPVPYHFKYDARLDIPTITPPSDKFRTGQPMRQPHNKRVVATVGPSDASIMNMLKSKCKRVHPEYLHEGYRRDGVFWFGTQSAKAGVDFDFGLEFVNRLYHSHEITLSKGGSFTEEEVKENFTNGYEKESYNEQFRKDFSVRKK